MYKLLSNARWFALFTFAFIIFETKCYILALDYLASVPETDPPYEPLQEQAHRLWLDARRSQHMKETNPAAYAEHLAHETDRVNNFKKNQSAEASENSKHAKNTAQNNKYANTGAYLDDGKEEEEEVLRYNRESDDGPGMTLLELAAVADLDLGMEPVTEATYKRCIDALIEKQKDKHNNVLFCAVCDMFDKKDQFKPPFNARNITDTKLLNGMRERLTHSAWVNQNLDPLPSARDQGVFDFDGCLEQALEVGKTHGNGAFQDLILNLWRLKILTFSKKLIISILW